MRVGGEEGADCRGRDDGCSETEEAAEDVDAEGVGGEGCEEGEEGEEGEAEEELEFAAEEVGGFAEEEHECAAGESAYMRSVKVSC